MKKERSLRRLSATTHQAAITLRDRFGPLVEAGGVAGIGLLAAIIEVWTGLGDLGDATGHFASFVVAAISVFFIARARRKHAVLIEVTMSYLVRGGRALLDDLLGRLIASGWRGERPKPGDALFNVLQQVCREQDWEMRRRVAEALPALGEIDARRALQICSTLREDFDHHRWRDDVRRRAVESLSTPMHSGRAPIFDRVNPALVRPLFRLRKDDQIFTAMAVAEGLHEWEDTQPQLVPALRTDLLSVAQTMFPEQEVEALQELLDLLQKSIRNDMASVAQKLEQMGAATNVFTRVAAARNILRVSERLPEQALDFMLAFSQPTQHKHVRRPIAKDRSIDFLLVMIRKGLYGAKAEACLLRLLDDPDEIIPLTVFEKAVGLKNYDTILLTRICDHILERQPSGDLAERVRRVRDQLV